MNKEINTQQYNFEETLISTLGIEILSTSEKEISAKMPVDKRTCQPRGFLHGGASVALAETVASIGANNIAKKQNKVAVGIEINANHIKSINSGWVFAKATPLHLGKTIHTWSIKILDKENNLICICRTTLSII